MNAQTLIESGTVLDIPLNKLKKSPKNARKTPHGEAAIEALAASIAAKGLLQAPVVEPETGEDGEPTGFYLVTIGEGRRLALALRAKRKEIRKSEPVRCVVDTANDPHEISLDENVTRTDMHPADQFEAFKRLSDERGLSAEDIGARFGVSAQVVRQRLRLGAVSPKLMAIYREDGLTLDQLMAFAVSEDHERQEQVYDQLSWNRSAALIRRAMTEAKVPASDRRAVFVGVDAYGARRARSDPARGRGARAQLGRPWFELVGWPVYPPPAFFWWWFAFDAYAPKIFLEGAMIAVTGGGAAIVVALALSIWRARESRSVTTYGSARWAKPREVAAAGLLGEDGVVLGQLDGAYLRHDGPEHVLCFAPTRSGKGVGLVVPSLLTWPGSVIVHDIKGENWQLTSACRGRVGRVLLFDPTNPESAAYNPLLEVRRGDAEVRDVQNVADILVDPEGALERRSHWEKTSHSLLVGAILHVLYAGPDKTLAGVAEFLSDPRRPIEATLRAMMATPHLGDRPHPVVASAARELLNKSENERSGVLSTAMSFLGLYRDPVVAKVTSRCDWRIADLVDGARPVSLYLVVPPSDISRTKPLVRLILNQIGRRLTEELSAKASRHRVLLMLDEFPALGRLDFFESALAFMAGYGLKAFLIAQSLNQIEKAYGPNNAILDNCHVRVCFATNDERTAKRVSDALGTATELRAMKNYAGHRLSPWLGHLMVSRQETARPLLTPGEVMQLPPDDELVLVSGSPPVRANKVRYFEDARLRRRVGQAATSSPAASPPDDWSSLKTIAAPAAPVRSPSAFSEGDAEEGGLRREPEPMFEDAAEPPPPVREFGFFEDEPDDDGEGAEQAALQTRFRRVARQAALDPDDGLEL